MNYPSLFCSYSEVAQLCPTLCDPVDCSLPGSSVHGIFQAIVLEWIAIFFSRGSPQPRDRTRVSRIVDRRFTVHHQGSHKDIQYSTRQRNLTGRFLELLFLDGTENPPAVSLVNPPIPTFFQPQKQIWSLGLHFSSLNYWTMPGRIPESDFLLNKK